MPDPVKESHAIETYKSMITISIEVFKLLVLINGAAAAGMVAGMNNILRIIPAEEFRTSIEFFVGGLLCATLAVFCSWLTQFALHNENNGRFKEYRHNWFVIGAAAACVASLFCFGVGAFIAAVAVS